MVIFINSSAQLAHHCIEASRAKFLALDTEFISNSVEYYPTPALIQIAYQPQGDAELAVILVDCTRALDWDPLKSLLEDAATPKVLHAAQHDVLIIDRLLSTRMCNIFDTQLAYAFLSQLKSISYQELVQLYCGFSLPKEEQLSAWLHRPLKPKQLTYAANDVIYLHQIFPLIREQVEVAGKSDWLAAETAATLQEIDNPQPKVEKALLSAVQQVGLTFFPTAAATLWRLLNIREEIARQHNIHRNRVLSEDAIHGIGQRLRSSDRLAGRELASLVARYPEYAERFGAVTNNPPEANEIAQIKELIDQAQLSREASLAAGSAYNSLQRKIQEVSDHLQIARPLIGTNGDLKVLSHLGYHRKFSSGWRYEVFGRQAFAMLNAKNPRL